MSSRILFALATLLAATQAVGAERLVNNLPNMEDLHPTPDNRWVIGSAMRAAGRGGALYAIAVDGSTATTLYPSEAPSPTATTQCPGGAPAAADFAPHGISLETDRERHTLFVVNHGGRETVEIFALTPGSEGEPPRLRWRDCIPLPAGSQANSVTPGRDGTVYVTAAGAPFPIDSPPAGATAPAPIPGSGVLAWRPGDGWRILTTGLALSNGLVISRDNSVLYVAEWLGRQVAEIDAEDGTILRRVAVDFGVDNLRLEDKGGLWLAGQAASTDAVMACYLSERRDCGLDSALARVDTTALAVDCAQHLPATPGFSSATVALPLGDRVWLGTFRGDAVGIAGRGATPGKCID